jgi:serine/threonine protein kinase
MLSDTAIYQVEQLILGGKYRVARVLGRGGMGVVYKVQHVVLTKKFHALKTIHASLCSNKEVADRFLSEAQTLAGIVHPNIVSVLDAGILEDGRLYFLMEYLEGSTLGYLLHNQRRGFDPSGVLNIAIEVCDALEYIHVGFGIIHRDLKPENIFVERLGPNLARVKILDFGIVHLPDKRRTDRVYLGTFRYSAPEQLRGEAVTPRSDLYALGGVIYELLCGRDPFADHSNDEVGHAHLTKAPPPLSRFVSAIPVDLEDVVMQLLSKDPAGRPESAKDVAARLRDIQSKWSPELWADVNRTEPSPMTTVLDMVVREEPRDKAPSGGAGGRLSELLTRRVATPLAAEIEYQRQDARTPKRAAPAAQAESERAREDAPTPKRAVPIGLRDAAARADEQRSASAPGSEAEKAPVQSYPSEPPPAISPRSDALSPPDTRYLDIEALEQHASSRRGSPIIPAAGRRPPGEMSPSSTGPAVRSAVGAPVAARGARPRSARSRVGPLLLVAIGSAVLFTAWMRTKAKSPSEATIASSPPPLVAEAPPLAASSGVALTAASVLSAVRPTTSSPSASAALLAATALTGAAPAHQEMPPTPHVARSPRGARSGHAVPNAIRPESSEPAISSPAPASLPVEFADDPWALKRDIRH